MGIRSMDCYGNPIYVGISKAIVIDNKDPSQRGRVRVSSTVFGETGFIHCLVPEDGFFSPPDIGTVVYVQADGCDKDYIVVTATLNDGPISGPDTPTPFRRVVPTNRGWVSPGALSGLGVPLTPNGGHILELDDGLATVDAKGNVTQTTTSSGIRLTTVKGHALQLTDDDANVQVVLKDMDQRTIEIIKASDRIRIRNSTNTIHIDIDLANDTIEVDAEHVKLGTNALQHLVRGDAFRALFNAHTHPTPAGPSLPPFEQMDPPSADTHLSKRHTVE